MAYNSILHIDDDEDDQELFYTALGKITNNVKYTAFSNARKALQQLASNQLTTDVIFLDLNMPEMNGQQFLTEIKKHDTLKDIPVIIFTTSSQPSAVASTRQLGAKDFITKPEDFNELVTKLKSILS